jgi:hypothetical protein
MLSSSSAQPFLAEKRWQRGRRVPAPHHRRRTNELQRQGYVLRLSLRVRLSGKVGLQQFRCIGWQCAERAVQYHAFENIRFHKF